MIFRRRRQRYCLSMTDPSLDVAPPTEPTPAITKSRKRAFTEWIVILVVAVLVSLIVRTFVFETYFVPSGSMYPTLKVGDRIIVDKLSVDLGTINRGDIVVFKAPKKVAAECGDNVADLVKRVIGLPGDNVTSKGNTIYINGKALKEKWPHTEPLGQAIGKIHVPAGDYFMIGDHHEPSCDSRYWGFVPKASIIGKVFLRIWPLSRVHWF
jgi:signal peptidase I